MKIKVIIYNVKIISNIDPRGEKKTTQKNVRNVLPGTKDGGQLPLRHPSQHTVSNSGGLLPGELTV